jgi:hypothetical protein
MERVQVDSSMISSVGHDPETQTLELEFKSGAVWQYSEVSSETHAELMAAGSVGSYVRSNILGEYSESLVSKKRRR